MRIELDFVDETDQRCAHLHFKQEGASGFKLPLPFLPELLEALEKPADSQIVYFWQNVGVKRTRTTCSIHISTTDVPLLQISREQCAKLIAHLRTTYAEWL